MSSDLYDIYLDPSYANILTQYGGDTVPIETLIWQRFVGINNIDVSQPLTEEQKTSFSTMFQQYQAWGLSVNDLLATSVQPTTSTYLSCYDLAEALFPGITSVQIKDMWNGFLHTYSLTNDKIGSQDLSALFTSYLKSLYDKQNAYNTLPASQQKVETAPEDVLQIALWNRFLTAYGYSAQNTSTALEEKQFAAFVQQYRIWNVTASTLQSTNTLPTGTGSEFFVNYIQAFYGQLSAAEQTDLWNSFLSTKGLSTNPPDLSSLQQPFVDFINSLQAKKGAFEAATALSPQEIAQRTVFSDVMVSLQRMLEASEGVVINNAAALKIYNDLQEEYTKQMTSAPNLVAVSSSQLNTSESTTLQIPSSTDLSTWDLSDYTFGYANISLRDVLTWAYGTFSKDSSTPLTFGDATSPMGAYTFSMTTDSDGQPAIQETFSIYLKDPSIQNDIAYPRSDYVAGPDSSYYTYVTQSTVVTVKDIYGQPLTNSSTGSANTFSETVELLETGFKSIFSALATQTPYPSTPSYTVITNLRGEPDDSTNPYYPAGVEGRFLGDVSTWIDTSGNMNIDSSELEHRTAQNAVIQQYVNATRARREMVQNATKQTQAVLQAARSSVNNIATLWTSILEAISTIVNAIYQKTVA
jgi:hypothetical protein